MHARVARLFFGLVFFASAATAGPLVVINGPSWHATPDALNAETWGLGIGYRWHGCAAAIGDYDNSNWDNTNYAAVECDVPLTQWWYAGLLSGVATGYGNRRLTGIGALVVGMRTRSARYSLNILPRTAINPWVVNLKIELSIE